LGKEIRMKKILAFLGVVALLLFAVGLRAEDTTNKMVRVRFVPGSEASSGLESGLGATFTELHPFPDKDSDRLVLHARAGIGDKFPVAATNGVVRFEVVLKDGNDDRVSLEILSKQGPQTIELRRDVSTPAEVMGIKYDFAFPSTYADKKTENKVMLLVSTKRDKVNP
jgi:hypothetical protein